MAYQHLTTEQRNSIEYSKRLKNPPTNTELARIFNKHRTTIQRELKRNKANNNKYSSKLANQNTRDRRIKAHQKCRKIENNLWLENYIKAKLKETWSPEQIVGRLKLDYGKLIVSKDTIYKYIYTNKELTQYLRYKNNRYRHKQGTKQRIKERKQLDNRKSIEDRPEIVTDNDYEGDYIMLNQKEGIINYTNRKHKTVKLIFAKHDMKAFRKATNIKFKHDILNSLTLDNDKTFNSYEAIEKDLATSIYFANAYHYWERGLNENFNGLVREWFPKKQKYAKLVEKEMNVKLKHVEKLLNNRPRKCLNYLTPNESFDLSKCSSKD